MSYGVMTRRGFVPVRRRGLGFTMWDLMAEAGMEDCDPKDVACVARNQERDIAVQDLWYNNYQKDPNTANLPVPRITIQTDSSSAAVNAYKNNQPLTSESISVGGGAPVTVGALEQGAFYQAQLPTAVMKPRTGGPIVAGTPTGPGAPSPGSPGGSQVISSNGTNQPASASASASSFSFASIPVWGWAIAAGVAFFAFGGGHGR